MKPRIVNHPGAQILKHCVECENVFYAADPKRVKCAQCKPVGSEELRRLPNFEGAHAVHFARGVESMVS